MTPAQLSAAIDTAQQTQSTTDKFGSWHQDSAARCADLVTSVIEPEIAERVAGLEAVELKNMLAEVSAWRGFGYAPRELQRRVKAALGDSHAPLEPAP